MLPIKAANDCGAKPILIPAFATRSAGTEPFSYVPSTEADLFANAVADLDAYFQALFAKLRLAVIYSGDKEKPGSVLYRQANTRPWKSYQEVAGDIQQTLQEIGFRHVSLIADDMNMIDTLRESIHMAWLNTGGVQGENPVCHASAILEMLGIPYVGHNPLNSSILDEKDVFKRHLQSMGIRTSPFVTWLPARSRSLDLAHGKGVRQPSRAVHRQTGLRAGVAARSSRGTNRGRGGTGRAGVRRHAQGRADGELSEWTRVLRGGVRRRDAAARLLPPVGEAVRLLDAGAISSRAKRSSLDGSQGDRRHRASLLSSNEASLRFDLMDLARRLPRVRSRRHHAHQYPGRQERAGCSYLRRIPSPT